MIGQLVNNIANESYLLSMQFLWQQTDSKHKEEQPENSNTQYNNETTTTNNNHHDSNNRQHTNKLTHFKQRTATNAREQQRIDYPGWNTLAACRDGFVAFTWE